MLSTLLPIGLKLEFTLNLSYSLLSNRVNVVIDAVEPRSTGCRLAIFEVEVVLPVPSMGSSV